jgi:hypothetical protein
LDTDIESEPLGLNEGPNDIDPSKEDDTDKNTESTLPIEFDIDRDEISPSVDEKAVDNVKCSLALKVDDGSFSDKQTEDMNPNVPEKSSDPLRCKLEKILFDKDRKSDFDSFPLCSKLFSDTLNHFVVPSLKLKLIPSEPE